MLPVTPIPSPLYFYPRSPCGERPLATVMGHSPDLFLSTLSLRRATTAFLLQTNMDTFLSTLSLRRATCSFKRWNTEKQNFYPRSPCGERPGSTEERPLLTVISIHALLAESDATDMKLIIARNNFYPRSPCGERPYCADFWDDGCDISIHALLAESDNSHTATARNINISIHALLAESDIWTAPCSPSGCISIHALLAESDVKCAQKHSGIQLFLSTLSLRRATSFASSSVKSEKNFYPRSPCGERRLFCTLVSACICHFYPRSPCGERRHAYSACGFSVGYFYPRSPCGERPRTAAPGHTSV